MGRGGRRRKSRVGRRGFSTTTRGDGGRVVAYLVSFGSDRVGHVFGDKLVRYIGRNLFRLLSSSEIIIFCFVFSIFIILDLRVGRRFHASAGD